MDKNQKAAVKLFISRLLAYVFVAFFVILCIFFFYLLLISASKTNFQLQGKFSFLPGSSLIVNFKNALNDTMTNIPRGMMNSFIVAATSALLTTYFSALTAYATHVYDFKFKKTVQTFIIAVMMIPPQVSAAGFVQLAYKYGLTNKLWVLIIPSIAAPSIYFYMKQYLEATLPLEMVEASRMDGSSEFGTFNRIVLPIMKPALAVQMIFSFVASWNNFFMPGLLLTKPELQTVPIMISALRSADFAKFDLGKMYMLILLAILPVTIVYLCLSKFIIKGVTSGSVKG
ncbi:MAG: carbohydrate ABC transporter permease [Erysipelotrichaceae bacterium]|nr:carbohydrate ABC transporter permease [Erysipelotrichaceae bacterium]